MMMMMKLVMWRKAMRFCFFWFPDFSSRC